MNQNIEYTGKIQPKHGEKDASGRPLFPYLPNEDLIEAVNLAIHAVLGIRNGSPICKYWKTICVTKNPTII